MKLWRRLVDWAKRVFAPSSPGLTAAAPAELRAFLKVAENVTRYFLSKAVIAIAPTRRVMPGQQAPAAPQPEVLDIGEIKGKPLGEPQ